MKQQQILFGKVEKEEQMKIPNDILKSYQKTGSLKKINDFLLENKIKCLKCQEKGIYLFLTNPTKIILKCRYCGENILYNIPKLIKKQKEYHKFFCSRCNKKVNVFHKTQKEKIYCSKCWNSVMQYIQEKNKAVNTCTLCNSPKIFWSDNNVFIRGKILQLCGDCYKINIDGKVLLPQTIK